MVCAPSFLATSCLGTFCSSHTAASPPGTASVAHDIVITATLGIASMDEHFAVFISRKTVSLVRRCHSPQLRKDGKSQSLAEKNPRKDRNHQRRRELRHPTVQANTP
uniref:Secreted protein n=1 Tax=Falco tinnunculus TaxID=100819 RepID=A0A8C4UW28_FALTI